jgi:multisubunit Na+/H+ antiporter MnhG subunit
LRLRLIAGLKLLRLLLRRRGLKGMTRHDDFYAGLRKHWRQHSLGLRSVLVEVLWRLLELALVLLRLVVVILWVILLDIRWLMVRLGVWIGRRLGK